MRESRAPARIVDVSDVRFRVGTVKIGVWITLAVCSVGIAYAVATWDHAHRSLIVGLLGVAWVSGCVVGLMDAEKIVRSSWRELFFFSWSALDIAIVGVLEAADGGARSPTVFIFVLPLAFAALSYPMPSVVAIALLDLSTYTLVSAAVDPPGFTYIAFVAASLGCAAALCVASARNHHAQRAELARVSRTDPLTDALNRRGFEERLDAELGESARSGAALGLMLLDLDNFKYVNDTQGHAAGDELLCWVVSTVRATLRPVDALGRIGGDEFAVVLPGAARADAIDVAERIERALRERVQATIGVAAFPADGTDREELHRHADAQLYGAKYDRAMELQHSPRDLAWAATLADSVDRRMTAPVAHSAAVAAYAAAIGERLGLHRDELSLLGMAAMLHDLGASADMVAQVEGLALVVPWIRHSHEHFDGSGYPDGLAGDAIPLGSRILLVADALHAMTSHRPYRRALSHDQALAELHRCAGRQFDPRCVDALEQHLTAGAAEQPAA